VAYYPFDDNLKDFSTNNYHATNYDAVFVERKIGQALSFNGKNTYVYAPVDINPSVLPQMTMTAWVKENDGAKIMHVVSSDDAGYDRAMGTDNRGPGQKGWACFAGDGRVLGSHPITEGQWTFIATVYDQSANTVKLFVDGSVYEKDAKIATKATISLLSVPEALPNNKVSTSRVLSTKSGSVTRLYPIKS